jgi:hypothetical protein
MQDNDIERNSEVRFEEEHPWRRGFTIIPNQVLDDERLSCKAKLVYAKLLSYAWQTNRCFPNQQTLLKGLGFTRPVLAKALNELKQYGYIEVIRRGLTKPNLYILKILPDTQFLQKVQSSGL